MPTLSLDYEAIKNKEERSAIIHAYLLQEKDKVPSEDGWYKFSIEKIKGDIGWSPFKQAKYLNILERMKKIRQQRKGKTAMRWIQFR
jgi:hypothetical protein